MSKQGKDQKPQETEKAHIEHHMSAGEAVTVQDSKYLNQVNSRSGTSYQFLDKYIDHSWKECCNQCNQRLPMQAQSVNNQHSERRNDKRLREKPWPADEAHCR